MRLHGIPQEFLAHAKRAVILDRIGLTAQALARGIVEHVSALPEGDAGPGVRREPWSMSTCRAEHRRSFFAPLSGRAARAAQTPASPWVLVRR